MAWELKVYRGIGPIAAFLQLSQSTVKKLIRKKKLPVTKEGGMWVMSNKDYEDGKKPPA